MHIFSIVRKPYIDRSNLNTYTCEQNVLKRTVKQWFLSLFDFRLSILVFLFTAIRIHLRRCFLVFRQLLDAKRNVFQCTHTHRKTDIKLSVKLSSFYYFILRLKALQLEFHLKIVKHYTNGLPAQKATAIVII